MTPKQVFAAMAFATIVGSAAPAVADPLGPSSGFLSTYTGPQTAGFEIDSGEAILRGDTFEFDATFGGPVGDDVFYVWGIDRGSNADPFGADRSGILFDSVLIYAPSLGNLGFVITDLSTLTPSFFLSPSEIQVSGDSLTLDVPTSQLPGLGFSDNQYLVSLWTRDALDSTVFAEIAQFAPSDSVVPVTIPEPATWVMLLAGFGAMGFTMRARKQGRGAIAT